jgi:hypothetical protein
MELDEWEIFYMTIDNTKYKASDIKAKVTEKNKKEIKWLYYITWDDFWSYFGNYLLKHRHE